MMEKRKQRGTRRQGEPEKLVPLPREVIQVSANGNLCDNIGLWLDRFLPVNSRTWELTQDAKRRKRIMQLAQEPYLQEYVDALKQRHEAMLQWFERQGFVMKRIEAKPFWRFVVGLGAAHVLETSITLHRLFGLPIIPGSALKGAARAYALFELAQELGIPMFSPAEAAKMEANKKPTPLAEFEALLLNLEDENQQSKLHKQLLKNQSLPQDAQIRSLSLEEFKEKCRPFVKVFGTTKQAGGVIFLDAIPTETPKFQLDIMNPHYPNYYRTKGETPPADWESPNPVFFLTVSETPYLFAIAARTKQADDLLDDAERWLKSALSDLGIGAKTSADYGYWEV
ncbi:MAG: CRISPR-associated protein Cmr6 [Archaeoglobaceae archaeon]|nr:CRISPR-associated protein Cmr6 [Archaeoglobaceae archaeon]MDK2876259.1 CRISPR-associated protein Cmr6 [Archaeoglobaceae archaeon]